LVGYGEVVWPVPVRTGELVGFHEEELTVELEVGFEEDEVKEDELEDEEPVAQDDFPAQASLGMAAAEPARAATKSDREARMVSM